MGQSLPPKNDFEHARGPRNSAYAVNLTYDRHTHIYISCKISIEHPGMGLASLAQLINGIEVTHLSRKVSHQKQIKKNSKWLAI